MSVVGQNSFPLKHIPPPPRYEQKLKAIADDNNLICPKCQTDWAPKRIENTDERENAGQ